MFRWLTVLGLLGALLGHGCTCDAREAACDQTLIALCEAEDICGDGTDFGACLAGHQDFTCTVTVTSSERCVEAVNDLVEADCVGFDDPELPCPLLTQAGLFQPCSETLVCAANAPCVDGVGADGTICSAACDSATACPGAGGCNADGFCSTFCSDAFVCAQGQLCIDDGCVACTELCGDACGGFVDGCDCPVCPECVVDDDCDSGSCVDGVCG